MQTRFGNIGEGIQQVGTQANSLVQRMAERLLEESPYQPLGDEVSREFDLTGPLLLSEVCLARALLNRLLPGECTVFRSRWLETHRDLIHLCNILGHEFVEAWFDGTHYLIKVRVRGAYERIPRRDTATLDYPQPKRVLTLDVTPGSLVVEKGSQEDDEDRLTSRLLGWLRP